MRPVVVRAELASPLVDAGPIHLDGLLALAWALRHDTPPIDRRTTPSEVEQPHLPLMRVRARGAMCWVCSAAIEESPTAPAAIWQTKRRDPEDWGWLSRPVNVASGPGKDHLIRRGARTVAAVHWLAVGDRREIVRSLRLLWGREQSPHGALGPVRRSGAGQIASWSVEHAEHTAEDCLMSGDLVRRHLPAGWVVEAERWTRGSWRSPYWLPAHQERVAMVGTRVVLHPEVLRAVAA